MITRLLTFFGLLCVSSLQVTASGQSLLAELEKQSAMQGLIIAGVMNQDLIVFPFSKNPFVRRFFGYRLGAARTSPDGTAVLGYSYFDNPGIPARRIALISADGHVIALLNRDVVNVADMAVSPDLTTIVFAGKDPGNRQVGIFLGRLGTSDINLAVPLPSHGGVPQETSVSWLYDGSAVVFSRDSEVWTYNLGSGKTALLFRGGTNPSSSPDGQWIAYRNSDGYAMIASRRGTGAKRASREPIDGYVHWSPDSAYYFVDEKVSGSPQQKCPFGSCFVVYRLRDGSRLELQGTDRKDSFFGWLRGPWLAK